MNIYYLGNNLFKNDKIDSKIISFLKESFNDINFIHLDPTEEFPNEDNLIILDTIINTKKVVLLNDIEKIVDSPKYSLHDLDLGMGLKLAKKMGNIKNVTIIGLPPEKNNNVLEELKNEIKKLKSN